MINFEIPDKTKVEKKLERHRKIAKYNLIEMKRVNINGVSRLIDYISEEYIIYFRFIKGGTDPLILKKVKNGFEVDFSK